MTTFKQIMSNPEYEVNREGTVVRHIETKKVPTITTFKGNLLAYFPDPSSGNTTGGRMHEMMEEAWGLHDHEEFLPTQAEGLEVSREGTVRVIATGKILAHQTKGAHKPRVRDPKCIYWNVEDLVGFAFEDETNPLWETEKVNFTVIPSFPKYCMNHLGVVRHCKSGRVKVIKNPSTLGIFLQHQTTGQTTNAYIPALYEETFGIPWISLPSYAPPPSPPASLYGLTSISDDDDVASVVPEYAPPPPPPPAKKIVLLRVKRTPPAQPQNSTLAAFRKIVQTDYDEAVQRNREAFTNADTSATAEYIFKNQQEDAARIVAGFHDTNILAATAIKRTKVGADGVMIQIGYLMATHSDDNFVVPRENVFFITGMNNRLWQDELRKKMPACFRDNVYHHRGLVKLQDRFKGLRNAVIIVDEIDTGDKQTQVMDILLTVSSGLLDANYMDENRIRFVFISATNVNELKELSRWGERHQTFWMTIPPAYIGHMDFLRRGIIKDFYEIRNVDTAKIWLREDCLDNYGTDYRVHIIRVTNKTKQFVIDACDALGVAYRNHTHEENIAQDVMDEIFTNVTRHLVIIIKGLFRRATLIPNSHKLKIGATMERYSARPDTSIQIQGLPGRMTGYWRAEIDAGHKTGPHRTCVAAVHQYEAFYAAPMEPHEYTMNQQQKKLMVAPENVKGLDALPDARPPPPPNATFRAYATMDIARGVCAEVGNWPMSRMNPDGFYITAAGGQKRATVISITEAIRAAGKGCTTQRLIPCYVDVKDKTTERFVVVFRSEADKRKLPEVDAKWPHLPVPQ